MPSISYVVARSWPENVIGCDNKLPWHQKADLQRFKKITSGHVVIMGRLTHESIGRTLPNRINVVLTREPPPDRLNSFWNLADTALLWANSRETALYLADLISIQRHHTEFFVIGGSYMFDMFEDLFNRVYLTEVISGKIPGADAFFDYKFDGRKWATILEEDIPAGPQDQFPTRYKILDRKFKTVRYVEVENYFTSDDDTSKWAEAQIKSAKDRRKPKADETLQLQYKLFSEEKKASS
jgi:dihydrofolate reductase